jgi:hypothetical protein
MLGNLAAFMFAGVNMTASLFARLDQQFHWQEWHGTYAQVLPYLREAFTRVLEDLEGAIDPLLRPDVVPVVYQLCNPDLFRRGLPKGIGRYDQYSLERYVTRFDLLSKRFKINLRSRLKAK